MCLVKSVLELLITRAKQIKIFQLYRMILKVTHLISVFTRELLTRLAKNFNWKQGLITCLKWVFSIARTLKLILVLLLIPKRIPFLSEQALITWFILLLGLGYYCPNKEWLFIRFKHKFIYCKCFSLQKFLLKLCVVP
jgi:hypothetical protein